MLVGRFNKLTEAKYRYVIERRKSYTDYNRLGLFRSILENDKLDIDAKIRVRDFAIEAHTNYYEFLIARDLDLYVDLELLGEDVLPIQRKQFKDKCYEQAQKELIKRGLTKHQVGSEGKHLCGIDYCGYNGTMQPNGKRRYPVNRTPRSKPKYRKPYKRTKQDWLSEV